MNLQSFNEVLGWTLVHSLWQGMVVALLAALILWVLPNHKSRSRYLATMGLLLSLPLISLVTFLNIQTPEGTGLGVGLPLAQSLIAENMDWIVMLWSWGLALVSLRFCGGLLVVRRLRSNYQQMPVHWERRLKELCRLMGMKKVVRVGLSAKVDVPMVIGHLKPVILIPLSCMARLSPAELEALILHELGHIRRHDYLLNLAQSLVDIFFFHHPAVWWLSKRIREEREHCCDDLAVAACGDPLTFAKALTHLQEVSMKKPKLAMAASGRGKQLLHRVKRLFGNADRQTAASWGKLTVLLLGAVLFLSAAQSTQVSDTNQDNASAHKMLHHAGDHFHRAVDHVHAVAGHLLHSWHGQERPNVVKEEDLEKEREEHLREAQERELELQERLREEQERLREDQERLEEEQERLELEQDRMQEAQKLKQDDHALLLDQERRLKEEMERVKAANAVAIQREARLLERDKKLLEEQRRQEIKADKAAKEKEEARKLRDEARVKRELERKERRAVRKAERAERAEASTAKEKERAERAEVRAERRMVKEKQRVEKRKQRKEKPKVKVKPDKAKPEKAKPEKATPAEPPENN